MFTNLINIKTELDYLYNQNKFIWIIVYIKTLLKLIRVVFNAKSWTVNSEFLKNYYYFIRTTEIYNNINLAKYNINIHHNTIKFDFHVSKELMTYTISPYVYNMLLTGIDDINNNAYEYTIYEKDCRAINQYDKIKKERIDIFHEYFIIVVIKSILLYFVQKPIKIE